MRVELNSGEVVVRAIGNDLHMDYTGVEETTLLAAQWNRWPHRGPFVMRAATLALVEGLSSRVRLGVMPVKGCRSRWVHEVVGARPRSRLHDGCAAGAPLRLWGRPKKRCEMDQLPLWSKADAGQGQVAALVGDPGSASPARP